MLNQNPLNQKTSKESKDDIQNVLTFLKHCSTRVESNIQSALNEFRNNSTDDTLLEAIRYSIFNGGKRIRPGLVYATAKLIRLKPEIVDPVASAVELIHCYSLIHDDLPAMDDDDMRRGKPSCHSMFGEAIAILAGDTMQALAFECLSSASAIDAECKNETCRILAQSAGISGMASGQAMDILMSRGALQNGQIKKIHDLKTGVLMKACITMVLCCAPEVSEKVAKSLEDYASNIGLCFQIRDDIIDAGNNDISGVQTEKPSYVAIYGEEISRKKLEEVSRRCLDGLRPLGADAQLLRDITRYITTRDA